MNQAQNTNIQVPDEVLKLTTKCPHAFSCRETGKCGDQAVCSVEYVCGDSVLFLKDRMGSQCPYRLSFGERQVCRCQVNIYLQKSLRNKPRMAG